ncbi:hypothetical protein OKW96_11780 [Sphingobacterium sp. KU25419]|nr:hypothetical protein OKW96_11780 [Sphingobacterium sp. KU25419]
MFGQSDHVTIYSAGEYFRFDASYDHRWNSEWTQTKEEWEAARDRKFQFPWPIIPIFTDVSEIEQDINEFLDKSDFTVATIIKLRNVDEIKFALDELAKKIEMYLFLKKINLLIFENSTATKIEIVEQGDTLTISINGEEKAKWLKKTTELNVPDSVSQALLKDKDVPEKIKNATNTEIVLAAKLSMENL